MQAMIPIHLIEAKSATVAISDDGRSAEIAFVSAAPGSAHYRFRMDRRLLDRLVLQITREQARVPKPARHRPSARESI